MSVNITPIPTGIVDGDVFTAAMYNKIAEAINQLIEQKADVTSLNNKQDIISDLIAIRSGATKGMSSVQITDKGVADGVASLDSNGKVPSTQLPTMYNSVSEFVDTLTNDDWKTTVKQSALGSVYYIRQLAKFAQNTNRTEAGILMINPEICTLYIRTATNQLYRWNNISLVIIASVEIGEEEGQAFDGKRGKDLETKVDNHIGDTNEHLGEYSQQDVENVLNGLNP